MSPVSPLTPDQIRDWEFGLVSLAESCQDPMIDDDGNLRECRRIANHRVSDRTDPRHCSGFRAWRVWWL